MSTAATEQSAKQETASAVVRAFTGTTTIATLRLFLENLLVLNDEAVLRFSDKGSISAALVDAAHVAFARCVLAAAAWQLPNVQGAFDVAIDIKGLNKYLALWGDKTAVQLSATPEGVEVRVENGMVRRFKALDQSALTAPKMPALSHANRVDVPGAVASKLCAAIGQLYKPGDGFIVIEQSQPSGTPSFRFVAENENGGFEHAMSGAGRIGQLEGKPAEGSTTVALDYIAKMWSRAGDKTLIQVEVQPDYPVRSSWTEDTVSVEYLLAPRIESE